MCVRREHLLLGFFQVLQLHLSRAAESYKLSFFRPVGVTLKASEARWGDEGI